MQLVAYGAQDIYLTGNPQITFFKVVYRRHTNFSMEAIEQTWNGTSDGTNGRCTATISRNGDLVYRMYLEVDGETSACNPGVSWIKNIELEIGGQKIDKHSGVWMETWAELTEKNIDYRSGNVTGENFNARNDITNRFRGSTLFQNMAGYGGVSRSNIDFGPREKVKYYVPLQFWFCRNVGLALPLIALQYHEVKVILDHEIRSIFGDKSTSKLYADYIYLDTDERRRFAQVSHEYLIEQVQEQQLLNQLSNNLNFNHPVKELIWTAFTNGANPNSTNANQRADDFDDQVKGGIRLKSLFKNTYKEYYPKNGDEETIWRDSGSLYSHFTLKLNGHERFSMRPSTYFSRTQIKEHHTGPGGINLWEIEDDKIDRRAVSAAPLRSDENGDSTGFGVDTIEQYCGEGLNDSICVYSFALKPEEHQPSGTCNFSRIDNAQLTSTKKFLLGNLSFRACQTDFEEHTYEGVIFAVNYNVLRIMSGMGGLAYSN